MEHELLEHRQFRLQQVALGHELNELSYRPLVHLQRHTEQVRRIAGADNQKSKLEHGKSVI